MDRRSLLHIAAIAAGTLGSSRLDARIAGASQPVAHPEYPPVDARSVWLVGDTGPLTPADHVRQFSEFARRQDMSPDTFLVGSAVAGLEQAVAALFGKEDAAFFPTGTMANNIAVRLHCRDRSRAIVQHESHLYADESDSVQRLANINLVPLAPGRAAPTYEEISAEIDAAEKGRFPVKVGAISIESPVRRMGGEVVPASEIARIAALAKAHGIGLHLDGARTLLVPSMDVKAYAAPFDTVYLSLYKYLGAPFGAVLSGSRAQMSEARELRHAYGGMIYQGWMPAWIAGNALRTFPSRIAKAHDVAGKLIELLEASGKIRCRPNPNASNIHQLEMSEALAIAGFERARRAGVRMAAWKDGALPLFVNETIIRRPLAEYRSLFLG